MLGAADLHREGHVPDGVVRRRVDVDPDHRRHRADEQDRRRAGLGAQEVAQRRLEVARPRGPAGERPDRTVSVSTSASPSPGSMGKSAALTALTLDTRARLEKIALQVHTTTLRSEEFAITVAGRPATVGDVFPGLDEHDRLGIVIHHDLGAAGAGSLILAAVTAFYDCLRATGEDVLRLRGLLRLPRRRRPRHVCASSTSTRRTRRWWSPPTRSGSCEAVNDRAITRLLVPDAEPPPPPTWPARPSTAHNGASALRWPTHPAGRPRDADVVVRGSAQSDAYIDAMLGSPGTPEREAQSFRRLILDQALGMLLAARG